MSVHLKTSSGMGGVPSANRPHSGRWSRIYDSMIYESQHSGPRDQERQGPLEAPPNKQQDLPTWILS